MAFDFSKLLRGTLDYSPSQGVADQDMSWADIGGINISPAPQPEPLSPEQRAAANNLGGQDFGHNWASDWIAERDARFAEQERLKEQDRQRLVNLNKDPGPAPAEVMTKKYLTAANIGPQVQDVWDQDSGWYKTGPAYEYGFLSEPSNWIPYAKALGYTGPFYNAVPSSNPEAEGGTDSVIAPEFTGFIKKAQAAGYDLAAQADQINKRKVTFGLLTPDGSLQGEQIRGSGSVFEKLAPMALMALGASPLGGMLGSSAASTLGISGLTAAQTAALGSAIGSGGITALRGGDIGDVLKSAAAAGLPQVVNEIVAPFANTIGADVFNATDSKFLSDIVSGAVKGVPGALMSGDASNLLTGAVTGAVGSQVGEQLGLTPQQGQAVTSVASKLLQGGDLSPADLMRIGTSFGGKTPTASETAVGGGAETSGFFDAEEAQAVQDDIDSLLARYPETAPSFFPEFDQPLLTAEPVYEQPPTPEPEPIYEQPPTPATEPTVSAQGIASLFPEFDAPLLTQETEEPVAPVPATEQVPFLEANIEDPATVEQLLKEQYPELFALTPDTGAYYAPTPEEEKYADEDRLLAKYPAPAQVAEPKTSMDPMELNKFLEANIEDPATVEQLMQDYFPDLYKTPVDQTITVVGNKPQEETFFELPEAPVMQDLYQPPGVIEGPSTIEVTGTRPKNDVIIPNWDFMEELDRTPASPTDTTPQPPVLDDDRTVAPTPAPTPAPSPAPTPGPSPAPSPTPSPAPTAAQSGMDLSGLFALLGMMNQGREKPDPYQVAQINAQSPFGSIFDQQQDLLRLIGRG